MVYEAESGDIRMSFTGEWLILHRISVFREKQFLALRDILKSSDVGFGNAESVFGEYVNPAAVVSGGVPGGTYMVSPPELVEELKWMGINIVSTANNHAPDFGDNGIFGNLKLLDAQRVAHAGTGETLSKARAAGYLETPRGRVALVAASDWGPRGTAGRPWGYPNGVLAGEQSPLFRGRPGVNLLRHEARFTVPRKMFDALREMSKQFRFLEENARMAAGGEGAPDTDTEFAFMGCRIALGESYRSETVPDAEDLEDNMRWVRDARRNADWVIYSFHDHGACPTPDTPSTHGRALAHAAIDNGADIFMGHGPHRDKGIEIYKGKPILHSIGDFVLQNDQIAWPPYDAMRRVGLGHAATPADFHDARAARGGLGTAVAAYESVVVSCDYRGKQLKEVRLYPIDLRMQLSRSQRGRPILAEPGSTVNKRVLERFQQMSEPFGTKIIIEDGVGKIRVS